MVTAPDFDAYMICATPRTGSTLLCSLLKSSGVAGRPASYFNRHGLHNYARSWELARPRDARIDDAYVEAAMAAGTTPNGVFAVRIMAETMPELIADLAVAGGRTDTSELELLRHRFGRLRFVHLSRRDVIGQAVSWAKSLQTHFWHPDEEVLPGGREPQYDEEQISGLVTAIGQGEQQWRRWFAANDITPYEVVYEDLAVDPPAVAQGILDHLGLTLPADRRLEVGYRKQADDVNADWTARFRASRP